MIFQERPIENLQDLYDREAELERLRKAMLERAITLVIGFRRTGKTSLIKVASFNNNVVYVDARKFEERNYITQKDLLEEFGKGINSFIPRRKRVLKFLKNVSGVKIRDVEIEFSWGKERISFTSLLDELNNWAESDHTKIIVIIDEVQELTKLKGFNLLPTIAYAYDNLRGVSFVFAGSKIGMLYKFLRIDDPSSPLYGRYMEEVKVEPLSREQSVDFLYKGFSKANVEPNEKIIEDAVDKLDGIIGWLSYFGLTALKSGLNEETIKKVQGDASRIVINEFCNFVKSRGSKRYVEILKAVRDGARWSEIKRYLELKTGEKVYDSELSKLIKNLIDSAFVDRKGDFYIIQDPILRYAAGKVSC
jgi:AAA+ ATPase superfamily predicted ATPase